jgi:hypothetical protein
MANTLLNLDGVEFIETDTTLISKDPLTCTNVGAIVKFERAAGCFDIHSAIRHCNEFSKLQNLEPAYWTYVSDNTIRIMLKPLASGYRLTTLEEEHALPSSQVFYSTNEKEKTLWQVNVISHGSRYELLTGVVSRRWSTPRFGLLDGRLGERIDEIAPKFGFRIVRKK